MSSLTDFMLNLLYCLKFSLFVLFEGKTLTKPSLSSFDLISSKLSMFMLF